MSRWLGQAALVLFSLLLLRAQDAASPTLRITVTMVQVDAVVTDSHGRHVEDLRPEDFELRQDGQLQKVTYFRYIGEPAEPNARPEPGAKLALHKAPIGPPQLITASQVKRTVALVVDDLALSFENMVRVRDALRKYVELEMRPGDLVAIVRTGGGVAMLEQFTTDKRLLTESIDLLKWKFAGRCCITPLKGAGGGGPEVLDYHISLAAMGALGTIEHVLSGMRTLPGRKSVVFLSDSLAMNPQLTAAMDHVTDLANRSAVSLYTIDPSGLRARAPGPADTVDFSSPGDDSLLGDLLNLHGDDVFRSTAGLSHLAQRTGGLAFSNNNDIPGLVRKAADDQMGYYVLGYSPSEDTFEQKRENAKFHRITVKVRRPGVQVRWKSGFTGISDDWLAAEEAAKPKTREQELMDALASPFLASGLKMRLSAFYTATAQHSANVRTMLYFDAKDVIFSEEPSGERLARIDVIATVYRGLKQKLLQHEKTEEIRISEETYRKALKEGFLFQYDIPMAEPGAFLMRAVVRDTVSKRIGAASQFVHVPDTRKGQLAISSILLKLASNKLIGREEPSKDRLPDLDCAADAWVEGGPAVRRYRTGQGILYSYMVINPKVKGSPKLPNVSTELELFRNGKLIFTGKPISVPEAGRLDDKRFVGGGILLLGTKLTPGEYVIQVIATDKRARKKKSQVAQSIDFEVVDLARRARVD